MELAALKFLTTKGLLKAMKRESQEWPICRAWLFITLRATIKGKFNHLVIPHLWDPDVQTYPSGPGVLLSLGRREFGAGPDWEASLRLGLGPGLVCFRAGPEAGPGHPGFQLWSPGYWLLCCWKLASRAQSGNCAATTAISTGGSPRPPTFELSKEIGFQLSRSGALWLLSQEQTLGLEEGGCPRFMSWPMSLLIGNRGFKAHLSFLLSYIFWYRGAWPAGQRQYHFRCPHLYLLWLVVPGIHRSWWGLGPWSGLSSGKGADEGGQLPENLWEPGCSSERDRAGQSLLLQFIPFH